MAARGSMSKGRSRSINAPNALVRGNDLGLDARKTLTGAQITEISKWRSREEEHMSQPNVCGASPLAVPLAHPPSLVGSL